jgi:predicted enzyme related to lactoylglutathione lyase
MSLRQSHVTIDSPDPGALADFWAALLGWTVTRRDADEAVVRPDGDQVDGARFLPLLIVRVDDPKVAKSRVHLDLLSDDLEADVDRAVALGARRADVGQGDVPWVVLEDPHGNELCVVPRPEA